MRVGWRWLHRPAPHRSAPVSEGAHIARMSVPACWTLHTVCEEIAAYCTIQRLLSTSVWGVGRYYV